MTKRREPGTVQEVLKRFVRQAGGEKWVAAFLDIVLSRVYARIEPDGPFTYGEVRRITLATGATAAAEDLAIAARGTFTPLEPCEDTLTELLEEGEKEHGAFLPRLIAALADGGVEALSAKKRAEFERDVDRLGRAYFAVRRKLGGADGL